MKLVKVALLGAAMLALSACGKQCDVCEACKTCADPSKLSKSQTINLMINSFDAFKVNSKFSILMEMFHGTEDTMDEEPYKTEWLEGETASNYMTFTCSEKPTIPGLRWDMQSNAMYEYTTTGWQSSELLMNTNGGFGDSSRVGVAYARINSAWESVDYTLTEQALHDYESKDYHIYFHTTQEVDLTFIQTKEGAQIHSLSLLHFFSTYYVRNTITFASFGECVMDEVF